MIGLLDRPTNGKIFIDGVDTTTLNDNKISSFRNKKLDLFSNFQILLNRSFCFGKCLASKTNWWNYATAEKDARDLLKSVGLERPNEKRANKISGGQAQRAAIARGLD